jgi:hypothetical protein
MTTATRVGKPAAYRWNDHYRDDGIWCRWSLCSAPTRLAGTDDERCPADCPASKIEPAPAG